MFVCCEPGGVTPLSGTKDTMLRVVKKTTLWGKPALVINVISVGEDEVYFTEQDFPPNHDAEWDEAGNKIKAGERVRMKRPLPGEQLIMTVDQLMYDAVNHFTTVWPADGGSVTT